MSSPKSHFSGLSACFVKKTVSAKYATTPAPAKYPADPRPCLIRKAANMNSTLKRQNSEPGMSLSSDSSRPPTMIVQSAQSTLNPMMVARSDHNSLLSKARIRLTHSHSKRKRRTLHNRLGTIERGRKRIPVFAPTKMALKKEMPVLGSRKKALLVGGLALSLLVASLILGLNKERKPHYFDGVADRMELKTHHFYSLAKLAPYIETRQWHVKELDFKQIEKAMKNEFPKEEGYRWIEGEQDGLPFLYIRGKFRKGTLQAVAIHDRDKWLLQEDVQTDQFGYMLAWVKSMGRIQFKAGP
jgi:hypothetical protein